MKTSRLLQILLLSVTIAGPYGTARAGEAYGAIGMPGLMGGYAQEFSPKVTLRADYATLGSRRVDGTEEGIYYRGRVKARRVGLFADYFPMSNGFRLTSGLTLNHMKVRLDSDFSGGTVNVGGMDYVVGSGAYINARVQMPRVTPYVGIGWGHHRREPGWGVVADLGVSIGKAKVDVDTNLASFGVPQADIDREIGELRDAARDIRVIPQASVGMSYRY